MGGGGLVGHQGDTVSVQAEERGTELTGGIDRGRNAEWKEVIDRLDGESDAEWTRGIYRLDGGEGCRLDRRSRRTGRGRGTQSGQEE